MFRPGGERRLHYEKYKHRWGSLGIAPKCRVVQEKNESLGRVGRFRMPTRLGHSVVRAEAPLSCNGKSINRASIMNGAELVTIP